MLETIITELAPAVLSVVAVLISMLKGKTKKVKTPEEIEKIAEAKKQKLVSKLQKKNGVKPIETKMEVTQVAQAVSEVNQQPSWQKAYGVNEEMAYHEQWKENKTEE